MTPLNRSEPRFLGRLSLCACLPLLATQDPRFVERRLSGALATRDALDVGSVYVPSPDGTRVAFSSDSLYVSGADGSSPPIVLDARPTFDARWTPDGTRLVYLSSGVRSVLADGSAAPVLLSTSGTSLTFADGGSRVLFEVFGSVRAAPVDGSAPSYPLAPHFDSSYGFQVDASGAWLAYQDQGDLYSVPVDGSAAPLRLNPVGVEVYGFEIPLSGGPAIYRASNTLWTVPLDASAPPSQITPTMIWTRELSAFDVTDDGTKVVYISDLTNNNIYEMYSVPADGSAAPSRLTPLSSGGVLVFRLSPDGTTAVYVDAGGNLFSVPTDASAPPRDLGAGMQSEWAWPTLAITPDSNRCLYLDRAGLGRDAALIGGPIDGSEPLVRIDSVVNPSAAARSLAVTDDSMYALYVSDGVLDERFELFRHEFATGENVRLSGPLFGHADVSEFRLAADGARVFWRADSRVIGQLDLFARLVLDGPAPALLRPPGSPVTAGSVGAFRPSRGRVLFLADVTSLGEKELFIVPEDGRTPPRRLSPLGHGNVVSFLVSADETTAVFLSEANAEGREELFRVALDGTSPAVRLHDPCVEGQEVTKYALTPDGRHVVFTRYGLGAGDLFSAPLAGGPTRLLGHFNSYTPQFVITPDSSAVVHADGLGRLYVSHLGSGDTQELVDAGAPLGALTATSARAVYRAGGRLFSVPLDGGTAIELNDPLPSGGTVVEHELTPDGAWVVYRADAQLFNRFLLLRVATDRSSPPLVLNGPLAAGSDVTLFVLSADGTYAIYSAMTHNYSVPVAGGPVLQIGSPGFPLVPPVGNFVLLNDQITPLDGSAPTPLPPYEFRNFWSDGKRLLMHAPSTKQLLSVRLDGRHEFLLTPPLAGSGSSARQNGEGLVYRDARGSPGVSELYSSVPRRAAPTR